jgi:hypothetical protein
MVWDDVPASFQKPPAREPWESSPILVPESPCLPDMGMKGAFFLGDRFRFSAPEKKRKI